ncbi:MAG TPA: TIM barrel protein [Vicinamibacterales bacterium]|nr:TIM barrel protein [Vicinamibacterales bacterium]
MRRREFLGAVTASLVVGAANGKAQSATGAQATAAPPARKGRIKQGVTRGVFGRGANFEDSCREAARLGIKGFDLTGPDDWPMLKKYGLVPSMYSGAGGTIASALNRKENHEKLLADMNAAIDRAAANGVPNIITFSGNRNGMADAEGADNCVAFLSQVKAHAEDKQITICMEYLNSKVNHKDYMFDHFAWGVDVMKRVNSPRVKILYDIYHAQIMDGDIVRNIRDNFQWIGHFHTGGNPGRHEIDETNELNYRFIMQAIADLGFTGFVSHEYSPSQGNDPIATLEKAIQICDV